MDIWMTWCKRHSHCSADCGVPLEEGEEIIRGKLWRKRGDDGARRHPLRFRWHPDCWLMEARSYLRKHPYEKRRSTGRPKLDLTDEQSEERRRILRLRASLVYRQKNAALDGNVAKVLELEVRKQELIGQMAVLGSVPQRWVEGGLHTIPSK